MVEFKQKFNEQVAASATRQQVKKVIPLILVASGAVIAVGIVGMVLGEDSSDFSSGLVLLILGAMLPCIFFITLIFAQRAQNRSMSLLGNDTEMVYTFDERQVTIHQSKGEEFDGITRATYSFLWRVEETRTQYFLYVARGQMYVIDKSSITKGSIEELNSYFMSNIGYKYRQKR